jgi:predicted nuclease with TOPRIM domain
MKEHIVIRLEQLRAEFRKGQERLAELERETSSVNNSMLRISGAIQVLEELLEQDLSNTPCSDIQEPVIDGPPVGVRKSGSS